MNPLSINSILGCLALLLVAGSASAADDPGWPREYDYTDGSTVVLYQPQVESWDKFERLDLRMALALEEPDAEAPIYGSLRATARTEVDRDERLVYIQDFEISDVSFPTLKRDAAERAATMVRSVIVSPDQPIEVALDRLLANLSREQVRGREVQVINDPPRLFFATRHAVLISIDGEPILEPAAGSDLLVVINTLSDLFYQPSGSTWYLQQGPGWMQAPEFDGPWSPAVDGVPASFGRLPDEARWSNVKANLPGGMLSDDEAPIVHVSTEAAELLVAYGQPQFKSIPGTDLLYMSNTESDIFLSGSDGKYYLLLAGRWFRTTGVDVPLEFCSDDLPAGFLAIPADHTTGRVLASVPGSAQAQEAAIAAQIPHQATVSRSEATASISYVGEAEFETIDGATDVSYAVNTSEDVFEVNGVFYAVQDAVWFSAPTADGPWSVLDSVPEQIYTIPPESPKYNVTYVYVQDSTPDHVVVGYYPGYSGVYLSAGLLVYGWGHHYYHHHSYYHHHHAHYHGHYNGHHGHHGGYGHHSYGGGHHYNHHSGDFNRSHGPGSRPRAGGPSANRPGRGGGFYDSAGRGVNKSRFNERTRTARRDSGATRSRAGNTSSSRRATGASNSLGGVSRPGSRPDVYAGRDGKVYKKDGGNWQRQNKSGSWDAAKTSQYLQQRSGQRQRQTNADRTRADADRSRSSSDRTSRAADSARSRSSVGRPNSSSSQRQLSQSSRSRSSTSRPMTSSTQRALDSSSRARSQGSQRSSQYKSYNSSRGSRTSTSRGTTRSAPSRSRSTGSRSGGSRGGGRRR